MNRATIQQQLFRQGSLPRVRMADDGEGAPSVNGGLEAGFEVERRQRTA
jgi:hypothetical protein